MASPEIASEEDMVPDLIPIHKQAKTLAEKVSNIQHSLDLVQRRLLTQQYLVSRDFENRIRNIYDTVINDINNVRKEVNTLGDTVATSGKYKTWTPLAPFRKSVLKSTSEVKKPSTNLKISKSVDFVDYQTSENENTRSNKNSTDFRGRLSASTSCIDSNSGSRSSLLPGYGCCFYGDKHTVPYRTSKARPTFYRDPRHSWGPSRCGSRSTLDDDDDLDLDKSCMCGMVTEDWRVNVAPFMWNGWVIPGLDLCDVDKLRERYEKFETFKGETVEVHNEYRRRHGCPELLSSEQLSRDAQKWAELIVMKGYAQYSESSTRGENIMVLDIEEDISGRQVVDTWYREHALYNYRRPSWQRGTSNFTQMIWKSSQYIGVGIAKYPYDDTYIVVAQYEPAGNINTPTQYTQNVPPPEEIDIDEASTQHSLDTTRTTVAESEPRSDETIQRQTFSDNKDYAIIEDSGLQSFDSISNSSSLQSAGHIAKVNSLQSSQLVYSDSFNDSVEKESVNTMVHHMGHNNQKGRHAPSGYYDQYNDATDTEHYHVNQNVPDETRESGNVTVRTDSHHDNQYHPDNPSDNRIFSVPLDGQYTAIDYQSYVIKQAEKTSEVSDTLNKMIDMEKHGSITTNEQRFETKIQSDNVPAKSDKGGVVCFDKTDLHSKHDMDDNIQTKTGDKEGLMEEGRFSRRDVSLPTPSLKMRHHRHETIGMDERFPAGSDVTDDGVSKSRDDIKQRSTCMQSERDNQFTILCDADVEENPYASIDDINTNEAETRILRREPKGPVSSYNVTADRPFSLSMDDTLYHRDTKPKQMVDNSNMGGETGLGFAISIAQKDKQLFEPEEATYSTVKKVSKYRENNRARQEDQKGDTVDKIGPAMEERKGITRARRSSDKTPVRSPRKNRSGDPMPRKRRMSVESNV